MAIKKAAQETGTDGGKAKAPKKSGKLVKKGKSRLPRKEKKQAKKKQAKKA
jgi:hypothetical protein